MGLLDTVMQMFGLGAKPEAAKPSDSTAPSTSSDDGSGSAGSSSDADDSEWDGPGDWAPVAWRTGDYTWEQADELDFEDLEDGDPTPPSWHAKRRNPTEAYGELHVVELNTMKNGHQRRMFAVFGIPVGWGKSDAEKKEFQGRVDEIEAAREEADDFDKWLSKWGFLDEEHYEWVRDRVVPGYADIGDAQELIDKTMAEQKQKMQDRIEGELKGELEPVEGVTMQTWAQAQASLASGGTVEKILETLSIDQPAWDRVSAEWNARMARDGTATIATVYGQAFSGGGTFGATGDATADAMLDPSKSGVGGEEPFTFEKWIEITEAQSAASAQGKDPAELLATFGLTPAQWGVGGGWWGQKFTSEAVERLPEYNRLSELYREKYATGDADVDVDF